MSDLFEEPDPQMTIETTQSDFIYTNPLLGVSDAYMVYSQALGVITGTLITEDTHRAIVALLHMAREIIEHNALNLEEKTLKSLKETTLDLETVYYGTEDSGRTFSKIRSRKRTMQQEVVLIMETNTPMDWDDWAEECRKQESKIFGEGKPFPKLIATIREILNNRIITRIDSWRKDAEEDIKKITPKSWGFTSIIEVKTIDKTAILKKSGYSESEIESILQSYRIPSEVVYKGMEFSDSDKKIQFTRFGVDPYYNLQRSLTEMVNASEYLDKIYHFSIAFKSIESEIISEINDTTLKITRLKHNGKTPVVCPKSFISLFLLLKKLNRLLSMDRLTLIERLELEDLRTQIETPILDFMSAMIYVFQNVLAHNPHLSRSGGKPKATQY